MIKESEYPYIERTVELFQGILDIVDAAVQLPQCAECQPCVKDVSISRSICSFDINLFVSKGLQV